MNAEHVVKIRKVVVEWNTGQVIKNAMRVSVQTKSDMEYLHGYRVIHPWYLAKVFYISIYISQLFYGVFYFSQSMQLYFIFNR